MLNIIEVADEFKTIYEDKFVNDYSNWKTILNEINVLLKQECKNLDIPIIKLKYDDLCKSFLSEIDTYIQNYQLNDKNEISINETDVKIILSSIIDKYIEESINNENISTKEDILLTIINSLFVYN